MLLQEKTLRNLKELEAPAMPNLVSRLRLNGNAAMVCIPKQGFFPPMRPQAQSATTANMIP